MAADYDKARQLVRKLADKAEREELKSADYWDEEDTQEEKDENVEDATLVKEAVQIGGDLLVDVAESLAAIAGRSNSITRGRQR